jgi:drug/metabolite transporter (DMT)-like permease
MKTTRLSAGKTVILVTLILNFAFVFLHAAFPPSVSGAEIDAVGGALNGMFSENSPFGAFLQRNVSNIAHFCEYGLLGAQLALLASCFLKRKYLGSGIFSLSALALVFYTMLPTGIIAKYGTIPVIGCGMTVGGLVLLPIVRPWTYSVELDLRATAFIGLLIIVGTVLAYSVYLMGVEHAGAVKASVACSVEPVAAAVFSAALIGNVFTLPDVIGFAAIISAVVILSISKKQ